MLRDSWTLSDIKTLVVGENDKFEWKSGKLLDKDNFRETLGKEISAFANSGGGHIIIGVANDGEIDGVLREFKGRSNSQEWLEKIIPNLVEPESLNFRVHQIALDDGSDKVVIVVDIADSVFAPFQEKTKKVYYYRAGSHSSPASHFYLEAIRNRARLPALTATLKNAKVVHIIKTDQSHFYQVALYFDVTNIGVITPTYWHIDIANNGKRLTGDDLVIRSKFPLPSFEMESVVHTKIVLPSQTVECVEIIGLHIPVYPINNDGLEKAIQVTIEQNIKLTASVITNVNICDESILNNYYLGRALYHSEYFESVSSLMDKYEGLVGQKIYIRNFSIQKDQVLSGSMHFSGEIENQNDSTLRYIVLRIGFINEHDRVVHEEKVYIDFLAAKSLYQLSGNVDIERIRFARKKVIYVFETFSIN